MTSLRRHLSVFATLALLALLLPLSATPVAAESGASVPAGFSDDVVWDGLAAPTVVAFAPGENGKVFVAEKNGRIKVFDDLGDSTATTFADLEDDVYNYWDRGLLGMVVDPEFPARPYVYVLYTYDHILGGSGGTPRWGGSNLNDACPNPPGGNTDGCVVSGRVERLTVSGNSMSARTTLVTDWCQQFPSHSVGSLAFGPDGALYATGGDGASFNQADYGQLGGSLSGTPTPVNPCGDPGGAGGALRAQDIRTGGDPTSLDGTVIRIDPDTGAAWPTNANAGSGDANEARIIAYGLRNPFRMTVRGNGDVWVGEVGWNDWEEINKISDPNAAPKNFGWPCFEGDGTQPDYQSAGLSLCDSLGSQDGPAFAYSHADEVVAGDGCGTGSSSFAGIAFLDQASAYPSGYDGGLFFTDYTRNCIWFAPSSGGDPDFGNIDLFANLRRSSETDGASVYLGITPNGKLIYTDYDRGEVRVISYDSNNPPTAAFTATPTSGVAPLHVSFDASASSDPEGAVTYAWDLDGDGQYDDSTAKKPTKTYSANGSVAVGLKVTDTDAEIDTVHHTISVGQTPPVATIDEPASSLTWVVGEDISFSGHATDAQDGDLPDSAFVWTLKIEHCPSNCHSHTIETFDGVSSGSFSAPNHDYPSHVRLVLKVADSDGKTDTDQVDIYPKTGTIDAVSDPAGIPLTVAHSIGMVGSQIDVSAPATAKLGEDTYAFDHWSDDGARAHGADVGEGANHLTAFYSLESSADASGSCSSAATILPSSTWLPGRLASGTDVDWFKFTNTSTRSVQIMLSNLPAAASLKLYKGCSTLVATSDRTGTLSEEVIKYLAKGTYAIKVTSKGSSSDDPYAFRIKRMASGLSVRSSTAYPDDGANKLALVGEVWNEYSTTRGPITVTAKLYDDDGHLLSTRKTETILYAVSHTRAPFRIDGTLPDGFAKVVYSVSAPVSNKTARGVDHDTKTFVEVDGHWQAKGTIKAADGSVKYLKLAMTLYDGTGRVIDVVRGSVGTSTLSKNKSTTFTATAKVADLAIDRAKVRTFGFRP